MDSLRSVNTQKILVKSCGSQNRSIIHETEKGTSKKYGEKEASVGKEGKENVLHTCMNFI